jgi:hypothetical protein
LEATIDGARTVKDIRASSDTARECVEEVAGLLRRFVDGGTRGVAFAVDLSAPAGFDPEASNGRPLPAFDACNHYLLTHCDELIAAIDPARYGLPPTISPVEWTRAGPSATPHGTAALVNQWLNAGNDRGPVAGSLPRASALHLISLDDRLVGSGAAGRPQA